MTIQFHKNFTYIVSDGRELRISFILKVTNYCSKESKPIKKLVASQGKTSSGDSDDDGVSKHGRGAKLDENFSKKSISTNFYLKFFESNAERQKE